MTVKRQLRWIVWGTALGALPFAIGYAIPFAFGVDPSIPMGLTAIPLGFIPLAFASAIIRYRLMDVEIILKRLLIYTSAVAAIVAIYVLILRASGGYLVEGEDDHRWIIAFLATVVVILLAKPVKDGLQKAIDRAFYRDRYDYRRALVGFARELNSDLDLNRLADRLVTRVRETIELDRMAFLLATDAGDFESISARRLRERAAEAERRIGHRLAPAQRAHRAPRRSAGGDPLHRRRNRVLARRRHLLLRAVRREGRGDRGAGARPPRQRRAAQHRRHRARHRRGRRRPPPRSRTAASIGSCISRRRSSIACTRSTRTSSSRSTTACW